MSRENSVSILHFGEIVHGEYAAHMVKDTLPTKDLEIMDLLSPYRKFEGQEKLK